MIVKETWKKISLSKEVSIPETFQFVSVTYSFGLDQWMFNSGNKKWIILSFYPTITWRYGIRSKRTRTSRWYGTGDKSSGGKIKSILNQTNYHAEKITRWNSSRPTNILRINRKDKIKRDGNCQFASVADQLFHNPSRHTEVRKQAVEWLRKTENYILPNTTTIGNYYLVSDTFPSWSHYVYYMSQPSVWGDHINCDIWSF